ncbi:hypothetical protein GNP80_11865 [Aliivibrio fischeri]|uniref:hypothetical protein n=1 Tax=Aliivibrio fischeri TaxID=668 RepID=UPI0012DA810A|nr:hypothetical protein [Aliivibrio fischeri]MUK93138.1 hypothetical protein [Aliivibrio fischeri]
MADWFNIKNDIMKELHREKELLWVDVNELKYKLEQQSKVIDGLNFQNLKQKEELNQLRKSTPEHYKELTKTSASVSTLRTRIKERCEELKGYSERAEGYIEDCKVAGLNTERIYNHTSEMEGRLSEISLSIDSYYENIENKLSDSELIIKQLSELVNQKDTLEVSSQEIVSNAESAASELIKIRKLHSNAVKERNEIHNSYLDIYGYEDEDEDGELTLVKGKITLIEESYKKISTELNEFYKNGNDSFKKLTEELNEIEDTANSKFNSYIDNCKEQHGEAKQRIDDLLPAALTAGLAAAYDEKVKEEERELTQHDKNFSKAIMLLVAVSCLPFVMFYSFNAEIGGSFKELTGQIQSLIPLMLPLYTPVLWLAYSANKKYKLSKRLIEEYTHKGVLSKTFEGLSKQVQGIPNEDVAQELKVKLLYNLVDVNSENPGKLISDYNKSDHPLMDALDKSVKLADAVSKLSRVPGLNALAKKLDEKGKAVLKEQDRKITTVLESEPEVEKDIK